MSQFGVAHEFMAFIYLFLSQIKIWKESRRILTLSQCWSRWSCLARSPPPPPPSTSFFTVSWCATASSSVVSPLLASLLLLTEWLLCFYFPRWGQVDTDCEIVGLHKNTQMHINAREWPRLWQNGREHSAQYWWLGQCGNLCTPTTVLVWPITATMKMSSLACAYSIYESSKVVVSNIPGSNRWLNKYLNTV